MSVVVAILDRGLLQQLGPPLTVYRRPANQFVADFIGESNLLSGSLGEADDGGPVFTTGKGLAIRLGADNGPARPGPGHVVVRPEYVRLGAAATSARNRYRAEVLEVLYVGDLVKYRLLADGGDELAAKVLASGRDQWSVGQEVTVGWDATDCLAVNS
jgi:spermidine/putrescine transport system ATP-binding protein